MQFRRNQLGEMMLYVELTCEWLTNNIYNKQLDN